MTVFVIPEVTLRLSVFLSISLSHLIYPLTARVVGAPQMISHPVSSIFPCPLGLGELQACPFPEVYSPFITNAVLISNLQTHRLERRQLDRAWGFKHRPYHTLFLNQMYTCGTFLQYVTGVNKKLKDTQIRITVPLLIVTLTLILIPKVAVLVIRKSPNTQTLKKKVYVIHQISIIANI